MPLDLAFEKFYLLPTEYICVLYGSLNKSDYFAASNDLSPTTELTEYSLFLNTVFCKVLLIHDD
jgi:hypothetical protein